MGVAASPIARARTDRALRLTVRAIVVGGVLLAVSGSAVMVAAGEIDGWLSSGAALLAVFALGWGAATLATILRPRASRLILALATSALAGLAVACIAVATLLTGSVLDLVGNLGGASDRLASSLAWLRSVAVTAAAVAVLSPLTFGFLLFPDGSLPSRRWRVAGLLAGLAVGGQCLAWLDAIQPGRPAAVLDSPAMRIALLTSGLAVLGGLAAIIRRLRTGPRVARQQAKWIAWGAAGCAVAFSGWIAIAGSGNEAIAASLAAFGIVALTGAYVVAIRHRWLNEIDLVVSRSLVAAALGVFVVGVSVGSLIIATRLFGGGGDLNMVVAIAATTGIAAGFEPLRGRLQSEVERGILGRTTTPHRVLSEFSRRVAANGEDPLAVVARSLVEGTGAVRAQVWLATRGDQIKAAEWPGEPLTAPREESRFLISHGGTELGALVLDVPAGARLTVEDRDLAEQVASGVGLAIRNGMLAATLEQRVALLRASRRRLIALQDETRRRLERDLHDGAQQQLVALRVKLGLARVIAGRDGATETGAAIDELASLAGTAIDALRDLARGVHPPLLEADGLAPSIAAEARRAPFPTTLHLDGLDRYHRDVEATVYLCVVEGLRQVGEAAPGDRAVITVAEKDRKLSFEVRLEADLAGGTAPRPAGAPAPRLTALADRVDTLSGRLTVGTSRDGQGVILAGEIPLADDSVQ